MIVVVVVPVDVYNVDVVVVVLVLGSIEAIIVIEEEVVPVIWASEAASAVVYSCSKSDVKCFRSDFSQ